MYLINYKLYNDMSEKISETEEKIGWSFPEDYISFIRKYNYAVFENAYFNNLGFQIKSLLNIDSGIVNSVYKSGLKVNKALNNVEYKMVPIIIAENEREKYASRICYNKEDDKLYLVSYNFEELNDGDTSYLADTFTDFLTKIHEKKIGQEYPLTIGRIESIEKKLKIKFPESFIRIIEKYNGENIKSKELYKMKNGKERSFTGFLNFNEEAEYDGFLDTFNNLVKHYKPSFPKKGVYPFSLTAGGDYLCLDYRQNKENPKIVYFTHDTFYGEEYETVADSFDEWYESLYKDPDKNIANFEL